MVEDSRGGDPSNLQKQEKLIDDIKELMGQTRTWTCLELSNRVGCSKTTVFRYLLKIYK